MGILSQFKNLKITAPKTPAVSTTNDDHEIWSSQSRCEIVEGSHVHKINGYSLAKGMGAGKCLTSSRFTVGGYDWVMEFYPDGVSASLRVCVWIKLKLVSPRQVVRAFYESKLLDQSGEGKHRLQKNRKTPTSFEEKPYVDDWKTKGTWGLLLKMKRSNLETSSYLKDDCLSIHCTIRVLRDHVEKRDVIHAPPSDMTQNLKDLLESEIGFDITLQVGDKFFRAHKWILASRSPVFRAQFFGQVGNPNMEIIPIEEFDPVAFQAMLLYLYSDELPTTHGIMEHLLVAADRFDIPRLKLMCAAKLSEKITVKTVATTLALAELHQCLQLKTVCLNFIAKPGNLKEVMKSDGYAYLENSCPSLLIDLLKKT